MSDPKIAPAPAAPPGRIPALDWLRGLFMLTIIGLDGVAAALREAYPSDFTKALARQFSHGWEGVRYYDVVFPGFLFVSGAALALALPRHIEKSGRTAALRQLATRSALLFLLGVVYNGGMTHGLDSVRWCGVLQRIAIVGVFTGIAVAYLRPKTRALVAAGLLAGYWAFIRCVPTPDGFTGAFDRVNSWPAYLDRLLVPGRLYGGTFDPEGLLSTLPAIATGLTGSCIGDLITHPRRVRMLFGAGAGMLLAGHLWGVFHPVIKTWWTAPFTLITAGWITLALAVFDLASRHETVRKLAAPLGWIGANAILLYMLTRFMDFGKIAATLTGNTGAELLREGVALLLLILFARALYVRKWFVRL